MNEKTHHFGIVVFSTNNLMADSITKHYRGVL